MLHLVLDIYDLFTSSEPQVNSCSVLLVQIGGFCVKGTMTVTDEMKPEALSSVSRQLLKCLVKMSEHLHGTWN